MNDFLNAHRTTACRFTTSIMLYTVCDFVEKVEIPRLCLSC